MNDRPPRREMLSLARPQIKIMALVGVPIFLVCIVVTVLQTHFFLSLMRRGGVLQDAMAQEIITLSILIAAIVILVAVPLSLMLAVFVSHRIVGPLRRMSAELRATGDGKLYGGFAVRDGDDLTFLGSVVTEMKESICLRVRVCKEVPARLDQVAGKLQGADAAAAAELLQLSNQLKTQLDSLQVDPPPRPETPKA